MNSIKLANDQFLDKLYLEEQKIKSKGWSKVPANFYLEKNSCILNSKGQ